MATFSQLPNEMISEIWEYVWEPQDVESFALVSKHIYATGAPFVDEHNKLKREYSAPCTNVRSSAPALLLKKILLWPRAASYVTHLSIGDYQPRWDLLDEFFDDDDHDDDLLSHQAFDLDDDMELFIEVVHRASSVPRKEVEYWISRAEDEDVDPTLALLLLLFPNLCTMTLLIESDFSYHLPETFGRMSEAENNPFLTRLTTVYLNLILPTDDHTMDWEWLSMSASLPSVQSIHVQRIVPTEIDDLLKCKQCFAPGSHTVKELALVESSIFPKSMFQLFDSIKGLKKFSYSKPDERTEPCGPFWIRAALVEYAKYSLESLKITVEWTEWTGEAKPKPLGSFRDCTNLREIETNVYLMEGNFSCIPDLFPVSIEKIHLHIGDYYYYQSAQPIIKAFIVAKSRLLPNMKVLTIELEPGTRLSQEDKASITASENKCRDVGIKLSVIV